MASKLFHAVVGVGISLGGVSACGGMTSGSEGAFDSPDARLVQSSRQARCPRSSYLPGASSASGGA
jgi:hypothetical protein